MQRRCDSCGQPYEAKTKRSRYCSDRCRKRRQRGAVVTTLDDRVPEIPSVVEVTRRSLVAVGRLESPAGVNALKLAEKLDAGGDTGSAMAALSKQHLAALKEATSDVKLVANPLDELRARLERRLADG